MALAETHTFRPNLIDEFRFGYYNYINPQYNQSDLDGVNPTSVGIVPMNPELGLPGINIGGYLGYGIASGNEYRDQLSAFLFNYFLSVRAGANSTFKFGAEIRYAQEQSGPDQGRFTYSGQYTGNNLADFLLGGPSQMTVANGPGKIDMRDWNFDFFVQDDWKVTKRLTLNLGLRYEYNRPLTETLLGELLNFYPQLYQGPGINSGLVIGGHTPGVPAATVYGDPLDLAPRVGFAYALGSQSKTVIHGGFGIFFDTPAGQITQQDLSGPPYSGTQTVVFTASSPLNGYAYPAPIKSSTDSHRPWREPRHHRDAGVSGDDLCGAI